MYVYILSVILAIVLWKFISLIMTLRTAEKRLSQIEIIPENHWFWGVSNKVTTADAFFDIIQKYVESKPVRLVRCRFTCFQTFVLPVAPSAVKDVLMATNVPKMHVLSSAYRMMVPWIGNGLLVSNFKKWERNRRLLTPAFHFQVLKPYIYIQHKIADTLLEKIKDKSKNGKSIDIFPMIGRATLDTMLRCTLSYNDDSIQDIGDEHPYVSDITKLTFLLSCRTMNPILFFDFIYYLTPNGRAFRASCDRVHQLSTKAISERKASLENDQSQLQTRHKDFLDILLMAKDENGIGMTDKEIRDEVDTFMFEGHDTTGSGISWALYNLAKYPELQEKVRHEVNTVLDGRDNLDEEDLGKLQYTTCFIKESMRMFPPVPAFTRHVVEPLTVEGVTLLPGDSIFIEPYTIHHNPLVWENHMEFRPGRFSPENTNQHDPFAFIPFSAGQRNCIGQHFAMNEMKILISKIIRRFRISLDENRPVVKYAEIIMRTTEGMFLIFEEI